jgi:DNA-binding transcriptional ArsR family regulator
MDEPDGPRRLDLGEVYELLSEGARRAILEHLQAADGEATVAELVELVVDRSDLSSTTERHATIRLHHVHLPKLAEAGAVEYNPERGLATLTPSGEQVESVRQRLFVDASRGSSEATPGR